MPRTTAALFTPLFESILLSLICYTAFHAFFSSTVPSDYTPAARSALFCSLGINVGTCFMQLVVSAAGKATTITADDSSSNSIGRVISYKHALAIANAHCCSSALLLLLYLVPFLQVAAFSQELAGDEITVVNSNTYITSQRVNWMHSMVGASGGWVFSAEKRAYVSASATLPVMGSLYSGIVLAYLAVMFLVSIYLSYMATPETVASYLFMEPRFLVVATGFLGFGISQMVSGSFASCEDPVTSILGFAAFVAATCWFDIVVHFCSVGPKARSLFKWVGLQILAVVPVFFIISGDVPGTVKIACGVLCASATVSNAVDVIFTVWNPLQALASSLEESSSTSSVGEETPEQQQQQVEPKGSVMMAHPSLLPLGGAAGSNRGGSFIRPIDYAMLMTLPQQQQEKQQQQQQGSNQQRGVGIVDMSKKKRHVA